MFRLKYACCSFDVLRIEQLFLFWILDSFCLFFVVDAYFVFNMSLLTIYGRIVPDDLTAVSKL